jgi:putative SOS response-associated peptidase YedK
MCGRMVMELTPELLASVFRTPKIPILVPNYNIAPTQQVLIVHQVSDHRTLDPIKWGLVPSWAKDPAMGSKMINARSESVAEKPSFCHAIKYRRCIVPASGYFEWKHEGKTKIPYYFRMKDGSLLGFAGIWEEWQTPDGGGARIAISQFREVAPEL